MSRGFVTNPTKKIVIHVAGLQGANGKDAYLIAVEEGYEGTREEWIASLHGAKGDQGEKGEKGDRGSFTEADRDEIVDKLGRQIEQGIIHVPTEGSGTDIDEFVKYFERELGPGLGPLDGEEETNTDGESEVDPVAIFENELSEGA